VIGASDTDRDGSLEQNNSLQRSASITCLSSPLEAMSDVSLSVMNCLEISCTGVVKKFLSEPNVFKRKVEK